MITIRVARESDARDLLAIYEPYVLNTSITFEYEVPSLEEFAGRIRNTLKKYPYLVAVDEEGKLVGYAYASAFKGRRAYDWAVENSVYVARGHHKEGIGRLLYDSLEACLKKMNILNVNACIAYAPVEDEHLNNNSQHFHAHMGYSLVGTFHQCGYKFDTWYDMIWMEKIIGEHTHNQPGVIPFPFINVI